MPERIGFKRLFGGIACAAVWMHLVTIPLRHGSAAWVMILHALLVAGMLLVAGRVARTTGSSFAHLENVSLPRVLRQIRYVGLAGFLFGALGSGLGAWSLLAAIDRTGPALTALLAAGTVGILVLFGYTRGDQLRHRDGALLVALAAGWILGGIARDGIDWHTGLIMLAACIGLAAHRWTIRYNTGRGDVFTGVAAIEIMAAAWVVFFGLGQGNLDMPSLLGSLVLIPTAALQVAALALIYQASRDLGVATVAPVDALTPALVLLIALPLGGLQLSIVQWCGGALILAAWLGLAREHPRRLLTGRSPAPRRMKPRAEGDGEKSADDEPVDQDADETAAPRERTDLDLDKTILHDPDDDDADDDDITIRL